MTTPNFHPAPNGLAYAAVGGSYASYNMMVRFTAQSSGQIVASEGTVSCGAYKFATADGRPGTGSRAGRHCGIRPDRFLGTPSS